MFRGKESSNRIELSRLVQELFNFFGVFGSLWLWGWGWVYGGGGWLGSAPHTCAHACARTHTHWGNAWEFPMMSYVHARVHMRACACMCAGMGGTLSPPPPTSNHPPPPGGTPGNSQNSIALELIEIFQFHLKI